MTLVPTEVSWEYGNDETLTGGRGRDGRSVIRQMKERVTKIGTEREIWVDEGVNNTKDIGPPMQTHMNG